MTVVARYKDNLGGHIDLHETEYKVNPFDWVSTQFNYFNWQSDFPAFYEDVNVYPSLMNFVRSKLKQNRLEQRFKALSSDSVWSSESELATFLSEILWKDAHIFALPIMFTYYGNDVLYYFHGASDTQDFDGSLVGFAWVEQENLTYRGEPVLRLTQKRVEDYLRQETITLQLYSAYLNGKVYDAYIYDSDGNELDFYEGLYDYGYNLDLLEYAYTARCLDIDESKLKFTKVEI